MVRKAFFLIFSVLFFCVSAYAQKWVEASDLKIIGKPFENTANPYHRVDTCRYKTDSGIVNRQLRCSAGMAVLFRTDTKSIRVRTEWGYVYNGVSTMPVAYRGYDLYIKDKEGNWIYAASAAGKKSGKNESDEFAIINNMDGSMHDCMMYLPMYSEIRSLKIGIDESSSISPLESPFRYTIAVYGSSFTQGASTSRSGMAWPMQLSRHTGFGVVSFGTSGRCMMQDFMIEVLSDVKADAFIFDTFSNPDADMIRARFVPFVDSMVKAHPGVPLIFQQTIYRELRNFNTSVARKEELKVAAAAEVFRSIKGKPGYEDVYFIEPNASALHETSVDGTHPDDYGYWLWSKSIEKQVKRILRKYNIK